MWFSNLELMLKQVESFGTAGMQWIYFAREKKKKKTHEFGGWDQGQNVIDLMFVSAPSKFPSKFIWSPSPQCDDIRSWSL